MANRFPYGPSTPLIRRFLVQLAALGPKSRVRVIERFAEESRTPRFARADTAVGELIERSGRTDARDAVAGPLLQLARGLDDDALDPIAEPALAALLALLVRDLLPEIHFTALFASVEPEIPVATLA